MLNVSKIILNNLLSNINWTNDKVKMYGKSLILKRGSNSCIDK